MHILFDELFTRSFRIRNSVVFFFSIFVRSIRPCFNDEYFKAVQKLLNFIRGSSIIRFYLNENQPFPIEFQTAPGFH